MNHLGLQCQGDGERQSAELNSFTSVPYSDNKLMNIVKACRLEALLVTHCFYGKQLSVPPGKAHDAPKRYFFKTFYKQLFKQSIQWSRYEILKELYFFGFKVIFMEHTSFLLPHAVNNNVCAAVVGEMKSSNTSIKRINLHYLPFEMFMN